MKGLYRKLSALVHAFIIYLHIMKTFLAEWMAIYKKRKFYSGISLTNTEQLEFDEYWNRAVGRKISSRWHKLYATINGCYRKDYFPDILFSTKLEPAINPMKYAVLYSDKSLAEAIYSGVKDVVFPETLVVKANGFYYGAGRKVITQEEAVEILSGELEFVVKPLVGGSSGDGVVFVDKKELGSKLHNKVLEVVEGYDATGFVAQKKLVQHHTFSKLCPDSVNTIRLITYICEGAVHHAPLCLRVGGGGAKVDNIHAGGLVVAVSDEGVLESEAYKLGYTDRKETFECHPVTGVKFVGHMVVGTQKMIDIAKELHANTPHIGIISWDFMVNENEEVVLVEGNYFGQSVWFPQIVHKKPIFGRNSEAMLSLLK